MGKNSCIAVLGTFDSKAEEHVFLKEQIEQRGLAVMTINVGTGVPCPVAVDLDLFARLAEDIRTASENRDQIISAMIGGSQNPD